MSTACHPQTDGQTEVVNMCVESYLRSMAFEMPNTWLKWISLAEYWYNTNYHTAIDTTPFKALYGYAPPIHVPYVTRDSNVVEIDEPMSVREEVIKLLKASLHKAQNRMQQFANTHRTDRNYEVGSWVYLKLHPYV